MKINIYLHVHIIYICQEGVMRTYGSVIHICREVLNVVYMYYFSREEVNAVAKNLNTPS